MYKSFQIITLWVTLIFCTFKIIQAASNDSKQGEVVNSKADVPTEPSLRSLRGISFDGISTAQNKMRDAISDCSKQVSHIFGINQFETVFNQGLIANFANQEYVFPPGTEAVISTFCSVFTSTVDNFVTNAQKIVSFWPFNSISGNMTPNNSFQAFSARDIAENLIKFRNEGIDFNSGDHTRKLQNVESFVSEAQNIIQQLGKNVGSMFGVGPFDAAMANSFLEGFLGTLGANSNVAGVFTDAIDQLFHSNSFQIPQPAPEFPVLSQIADGLVNRS